MTERDKLITANMGYVVTLARQYKSDILSIDDLVNEGRREVRPLPWEALCHFCCTLHPTQH